MDNLTLKDRKLLYSLDLNSRATNKDLGKKIGLSEQAVGYKLKVLEKKGIIKKYVTFVNTLSLGYSHYKVLLRLENINPKKEAEIIDHLANHKNVRWVVSCSGKWDINFSIMAKSSEDFIKIYRQIEFKFGDYIAEKNISLLVDLLGFTKGYFIDEKERKSLTYKAADIRKIDSIDKRILKSISQNARKNIVKIAEELNITVDIIGYRLKKLEKQGIISGYTIQIDYSKLNILRYSVYFSLHKMNKETERKMLEFARLNNNIMFIFTMIGTYDLSLELEVPSYTILENTIKKFRELFSKNIKDFEIIFNTNEHKYDYYPF